MKKPKTPKEKQLRIQKNHAKGKLKRRKSHKRRILHWQLESMPKISRRRKKKYEKDEKVISPKIFSIIENTEEMLRLISRLKSFHKQSKRVHLNSTDVTTMSNDGIVALLSVINDFKKSDLSFMGNSPMDESARNRFEQSGFFDHVYGGSAKGRNKSSRTKIFTENHYNVMSELTSLILEEATYTVFNHRQGSEMIQRLLIETMTNTHNHAVEKLEGKMEWWLSVEHDEKNNKVSFAFIDNGLGILKSIDKRGYLTGQIDTIKSYLTKDANILKDIFEGKLKSRTNLSYRGKGLPAIYKGYVDNYYSNLCVITNNAKAVFDKKSFSRVGNEFTGTLIYFELNKSNVI